jgi:hypothetical protein
MSDIVAGRLLAIDPGNIESAYVVIDTADRRPVHFGKVPNPELVDLINNRRRLGVPEAAVIEMVASYGMAVGAEVFETCVWIGRFYQTLLYCYSREPELIKRLAVKTHHCHDSKAKDSNVRQALVDRFAPGQPNHGKGTKARPGWFYGFHADVWQSYALAVYAADTTLAAVHIGQTGVVPA